MTTALITHLDCLKHDMGRHHPEAPVRLSAILKAIQSAGLDTRVVEMQARLATKEELLRVHSFAYLEELLEISVGVNELVPLDGDTSLNAFSLAAARYASGAVVMAVDQVMRGDVHNAFCAVRPPGHHALPHRAMGFCIFNSVAVGAAHALEAWGLERVAICDFDVHYGNGTADMFEKDERVLMCQTFQHPFYPYQGGDTYNPHMINVGLKSGSGSVKFREAIHQHWIPALNAFKPQLILISAGFDAHREDPLGGLDLEEDDYAFATKMLLEVAHAHAEGRIVSTLEGGYHPAALGRSVVAHLKELLSAPFVHHTTR
jgi:acetoin utilization deacetylase AcuC-like enzyme